ncbi:hypothetical protein AMATHDRAFT_8013 [Amanita thiersii Skay4041]|uniref:Histone-lysine N-methyltransferase, H3 lysine-36 specific n=1 Tax=Amanita thiersii Skay4041 TaxID=703135 RepID=A0A2A9NEY8_9AGAR|nr:hypothetical protein AMATHDRAFT_8013 [Amanita thiersii Skay4041]
MARSKVAIKKEGFSISSGPVTGGTLDSESFTPTTMTMSVKVKGEVSPSTRSLSPPPSVPMDVDVKVEVHPFSSLSPPSPKVSNEAVKFSPNLSSHTSTMSNGSKSETPTPPPLQSSNSSCNLRKLSSNVPQLIGDLPVARHEARSTFNEISDNIYQYKTLGRYKELLESMNCDCVYEHGVDNPKDACGAGSDCINRLTQVECLPDECRCGTYCQNQRFQRKAYADIEIVLTEKKGYGLRAEKDLPKDTFIYEYVGDVVNTPSFKKRMREYAEEDIQHFYFMMLQKDEFIDATKNGGIGRFANHSCSPNCYVAKWTVGDHVRMGIFAKRNIKRHEEITFNYNVDRYGHQAQPCFCGEPNCVGFIGGKTQTDIATMDDLYLDALGITDEADIMELKGTKKKRGKKIDDPDFMPTLKPILEKDVPKVVQAIRQTQSRKVLSKLLTRIKITDDQASLRQIMRLRGYSLMTNILEEYSSDHELITLSLQCMSTWPLVNRNKVEDSKLLDHWETLPLYNRIPKRATGEQASTVTVITTDDDRPAKKARYDILPPPIVDFKSTLSQLDQALPPPMSINPTPVMKLPSVQDLWSRQTEVRQEVLRKRKVVQSIIAEATAAEAAAAEVAAAAAAAEKAKAEKAAQAIAVKRKLKQPKKQQTPEEKEANKEKRLLKLIGAVVVKCMSKYAKSLNRELFKKYAKELTQVIADKEKKSSMYKEGKLDEMSEEKKTKIKKFAKEYISKVLLKVEKSKRERPPSSAASTATPRETPSMSMDTPNSIEGSGGDGSINIEMSVEEAMDLDSDSGSEEGDIQGGPHDEMGSKVSTTRTVNGTQDMSLTGLAETSPPNHPLSPDLSNEPTANSPHGFLTTDPRRRRPST